MKKSVATTLKAGVAAMCLVAAAGCVSQKSVDEARAVADRAVQDAAAAKSAADAAAASANAAKSAAAAAQSTAIRLCRPLRPARPVVMPPTKNRSYV